MERFGVLLNLLLLVNISSTDTVDRTLLYEVDQGYCTKDGCPGMPPDDDEPQSERLHQDDSVNSSASESINHIEFEEHDDDGYTHKFMERSVELMRDEYTFFAHIYRNESGRLEYQCPGVLFMHNMVYVPHYCDLDLTKQNYALQYRCYTRDQYNLPSRSYRRLLVPVTKLSYEIYFGIPTSTSLEIRVAHFHHDTVTQGCDAISPIGLSSDPAVDGERQFAVLIGAGDEKRVVAYKILNADREDPPGGEEVK